MTFSLLVTFLCLKHPNNSIRGAFANTWHNINFVIALSFALIVLCIAQTENYYQLKGLFLTKFIAFILMVFILLYNIHKQNKINKQNTQIIENNEVKVSLLNEKNNNLSENNSIVLV
jgi:hypothetical protein